MFGLRKNVWVLQRVLKFFYTNLFLLLYFVEAGLAMLKFPLLRSRLLRSPSVKQELGG